MPNRSGLHAELDCYAPALRKKVNQSFNGTVRPKPADILAAYANEYSGPITFDLFAGRSWRSVVRKSAEGEAFDYIEMIPFLSPSAIAYYLPAFLYSTLEYVGSGTDRETLLFFLTPTDIDRQRLVDIAGLLTSQQVATLTVYLKYAEALDGPVKSDYPGLKEFWHGWLRRDDGDRVTKPSAKIVNLAEQIQPVLPAATPLAIELPEASACEAVEDLVYSAFQTNNGLQANYADLEIFRVSEHFVFAGPGLAALSTSEFTVVLPYLLISAMIGFPTSIAAVSTFLTPFVLGFPDCDRRYMKSLELRTDALSPGQRKAVAAFWHHMRVFRSEEITDEAIEASHYWDAFL